MNQLLKSRVVLSHPDCIHKHGRKWGVPMLAPNQNIFRVLGRKFYYFIIVSYENENARLYYRSFQGVIDEQERQFKSKFWFVIHPFSIFAKYWRILMVFMWLIMLPYDLWMTAFRHCFVDQDITIAGATGFSIIMNVIFLFDMTVRLLTGYVDETTGECVLNPWKIFLRYLKSWWFWVDLYTVYFVLRIIMQRDLTVSRMYGLIRFIRLTRIVTIWKDLELVIRSFDFDVYIQQVRLLMLAGILLHFNACMICYLPALLDYLYGTRSVSWIKDYQDLYRQEHKDFSCYQTYVHGLMICLSYFHYGFMFSITTNAVIENLLVLFAMFCGYIFKALLVATIYDYYKIKTNSKYENIDKDAKAWQTVAGVQELRNRTRRIHSYLRDRFGMDCVLLDLKDLSMTVRLEICREIWLFDVEKYLLFRHLPPPLLLHITKQFILDIFMPNDVIYKSGRPADSAYFLCSGTAAVYSKEREIFHIRPCKYFGISAFRVKDPHPTYRYTTIAAESCQVLILSRNELILIAARFPQFLNILDSIRDDHSKYFS